MSDLHDVETRITAESGGQKGQKLARFDLLPVEPLFEVARLYGAGAEKYEDRNWELGVAWSLSFAALQRHAWLFWSGEQLDPETKRHHLSSVIFHAMALMEFDFKAKGTDDRPTAPPPAPVPHTHEMSDHSETSSGIDHAGCVDCPDRGCFCHHERDRKSENVTP